MADQTTKALRTNPFDAYRDPATGRWVTVVPASQWQCHMVERRPKGTIKIADLKSCNAMNLS
ncbi:MAG: hypothetical protein QNJ46_28855 [Leptolyngbyaceae cyanobacterium MO_188.B28]|nr:hypothetical protein [Leptolyngbyaceae cyanobacterium MO_188.B28]